MSRLKHEQCEIEHTAHMVHCGPPYYTSGGDDPAKAWPGSKKPCGFARCTSEVLKDLTRTYGPGGAPRAAVPVELSPQARQQHGFMRIRLVA